MGTDWNSITHTYTRTMAEQNASVYGKGATKSMLSTDVDVAAPDTFPPRFTSKPDTPMERLVCVLQEAMDVAGGMDPALRANTSPDSAECAELRNKTCTAPWSQLWDEGKTMFPFSDVWSTDVVEGQTLKMFCAMCKAKRVLEVGMFTGYGALSMAEALPSDGKIITCEIDPFLKEFAQPVFDKSKHGSKITVAVGPALDTINSLPVEEKFDVVFIDADKGNYANYYNAVMDRDLLAPGGVFVIDNALFKGQAYLPPQADDPLHWNAGGSELAIFNKMVKDDARVERVMLPVRDGILLIRRVDQ